MRRSKGRRPRKVKVLWTIRRPPRGIGEIFQEQRMKKTWNNFPYTFITIVEKTCFFGQKMIKN